MTFVSTQTTDWRTDHSHSGIRTKQKKWRKIFSHFLFTLVLQKSSKLKAVVVSSRQEKVNLAPTSRPSATSWLTGTTCSSRPPSRPTSRYAPKRCMIISCSTLVCFWFLPKLTAAPCHLSQLSGTDILDTIDSEATGTLKDCYVTLGGCLHGSGCSHKSLTCGWRLCVCVCVCCYLSYSQVRQEPATFFRPPPERRHERGGHWRRHSHPHRRGPVWGESVAPLWPVFSPDIYWNRHRPSLKSCCDRKPNSRLWTLTDRQHLTLEGKRGDINEWIRPGRSVRDEASEVNCRWDWVQEKKKK